MSLPMTLAPTNEAIGRENHANKNCNKEKKIRHDLAGHVRCKDSITIKRAQDFVRVGERGIKFTILMYIFFLFYRIISSINVITLPILSLSILVLH